MPRPVTLSSDFGPHYPGAMRAVLAKRGIDHRIDITHELPAHDVAQSAVWLQSLLPYAPRAVHCIVVDPGVGGDRPVVVLRAGGHALVAPDNGVAWPAATALASGGPIDAFHFDHVEPASHTFHGRDVFAPLAAAIAHVGIDRLEALPTISPTDTATELSIPGACVDGESIEATVIAIDGFGTAITSAPADTLPAVDVVAVDGEVVPVVRRYGEVSPGTPIVTAGSHGYVELAVNQGAGAEAFGVVAGDRVTISWS